MRKINSETLNSLVNLAEEGNCVWIAQHSDKIHVCFWILFWDFYREDFSWIEKKDNKRIPKELKNLTVFWSVNSESGF